MLMVTFFEWTQSRKNSGNAGNSKAAVSKAREQREENRIFYKFYLVCKAEVEFISLPKNQSIIKLVQKVIIK